MKLSKTRSSSLFVIGLILTLSFQNCSGTGFNASAPQGSASSSLGSTDPNNPSPTPNPNPNPIPMPVPNPLPAPVPVGGTITDLKIENTSNTQQVSVPITFGQAFGIGTLPSTNGIAGKLSDGTLLPLQVDVKAKHPDGSIRHAIISAIIPKLAAGQKETLSLLKDGQALATPPAANPSNLTNAGFTTNVSINISGTVYTASADSLMKNGNPKLWLNGSIANEYLVSTPFKTSAGVAHPHLTARFAVRAYEGQNKAKVDVTIENNWAYEPGPQNITYDVQIKVGDQIAYSKSALNHYHHARWKKSFWWGGEPQVHLAHNVAYLIAARALPNYDSTITIPSTVLSSMAASGPSFEPMKSGVAQPEMPTVGGRPDIGILPGWTALYLLSMDPRAKAVTLAMGDLAGSWSSHYRDKLTDRPMSVVNWPYFSILGNPGDMINPATKQSEAPPPCGGDCSSPLSPDTAHQPSMAYVPYLVTGDFYYLEELQFWTMWNAARKNPYYRGFEKGLLYADEIRGVAWSMRTLAQVTYITPDADPLKSQFETFLSDNLDWFNSQFPNNPSVSNNLGLFIPGTGVIEYNNGLAIAPWQDDFLTSAIGLAAEFGFSKALPMLQWKAKFPVQRLTGTDFCWISAGSYFINIRASTSGPIYSNMSEVYKQGFPADLTSLACGSQEMANYLKVQVGEMPGYSDSTSGYPSILQMALAYSVNSGFPGATDAWRVFMNRSVKPDYSTSPQFAIVPR